MSKISKVEIKSKLNKIIDDNWSSVSSLIIEIDLKRERILVNTTYAQPLNTYPSIDALGISVRTYNSLRRADFNNSFQIEPSTTIDEVVEQVNNSYMKGNLLRIRNMGRKSANELVRVACDYDLHFIVGKY